MKETGLGSRKAIFGSINLNDLKLYRFVLLRRIINCRNICLRWITWSLWFISTIFSGKRERPLTKRKKSTSSSFVNSWMISQSHWTIWVESSQSRYLKFEIILVNLNFFFWLFETLIYKYLVIFRKDFKFIIGKPQTSLSKCSGVSIEKIGKGIISHMPSLTFLTWKWATMHYYRKYNRNSSLSWFIINIKREISKLEKL